ncbi:MAG: response regulator [Caldilineaceae bacterium]|nr:response regulator [Caldilineaceae bacterium]
MSGQEFSSATESTETLREQVRDALEHLYDADVLTDHPLIRTLHLKQEPARALALRRCLIEAIKTLQSDPDMQIDAPQRQMYQVLYQRYVQCVTPNVVADQLSVSDRTIRRLQTRAIAYLADLLVQNATHRAPESAASIQSGPPQQQRVESIDGEIQWLQNTLLGEPVDLRTSLDEATRLVNPAAVQAGVMIEAVTGAALPSVAVHPIGLRQVWFSVFNQVIQYAGAEGHIAIIFAPVVSGRSIQVIVSTRPGSLSSSQSQSTSQLVVAQRILSIFGGELQQEQAPAGVHQITLDLPIAGSIPILVIDDNADLLQLYERFVLGTRYRVVVTGDPKEAMTKAMAVRPGVIVLDIIMPNIDGWSLLGQLRYHSITSSIPIIVSSIVSERHLAISLGAADFLQKPFSRATFLAALDRQLSVATQGSD